MTLIRTGYLIHTLKGTFEAIATDVKRPGDKASIQTMLQKVKNFFGRSREKRQRNKAKKEGDRTAYAEAKLYENFEGWGQVGTVRQFSTSKNAAALLDPSPKTAILSQSEMNSLKRQPTGKISLSTINISLLSAPQGATKFVRPENFTPSLSFASPWIKKSNRQTTHHFDFIKNAPPAAKLTAPPDRTNDGVAGKLTWYFRGQTPIEGSNFELALSLETKKRLNEDNLTENGTEKVDFTQSLKTDHRAYERYVDETNMSDSELPPWPETSDGVPAGSPLLPPMSDAEFDRLVDTSNRPNSTDQPTNETNLDDSPPLLETYHNPKATRLTRSRA
jgi:hypothetical protein